MTTTLQVLTRSRAGRRRGKASRGWSRAAAAPCLAFTVGIASAQTQTDLNEQAARHFAKADANLNQAYGRLMAKISPAGKDALRQVQRTWLTFRDQECDFETMASIGGSVHPMVVLQCKADLTTARTKMLQTQLSCTEGDVSCGGQ